MTFYNAFLNFVAWIFTFDCFRIIVLVVCCFAGWFCMSELARYLLSPWGGEKE